jgi:hypothetical protein
VKIELQKLGGIFSGAIYFILIATLPVLPFIGVAWIKKRKQNGKKQGIAKFIFIFLELFDFFLCFFVLALFSPKEDRLLGLIVSFWFGIFILYAISFLLVPIIGLIFIIKAKRRSERIATKIVIVSVTETLLILSALFYFFFYR